ncbi:unnamed protein product [Adineta steineri]|uniref:G domain-containing protein n=1 Tax=Adineta steineri TaxID=433720 RepID=A0A815L9A8_9BILA|nr:unnamed protein product [Adineta steineri]CAF3942707.1 unnamed protein product [Adineta steineri]
MAAALGKDYSVMLCGSARVGKSTLINAICGEEVAATSPSLDSCTKDVLCYPYRGRHADDYYHNTNYVVNFWDTPGFEDWSEGDFRPYFRLLLSRTNPICVIFCASPGSFANMDNVKWLVEECRNAKIFIALVCTNMWASAKRKTVMDEFHKVLSQFEPFTETKYGINFYQDFALSIMVNSKEYVDEALDVYKQQQGVESLIWGVMQSLTDDKLIGWCLAVMKNRPFWTQWGHRIRSLFSKVFGIFG